MRPNCRVKHNRSAGCVQLVMIICDGASVATSLSSVKTGIRLGISCKASTEATNDHRRGKDIVPASRQELALQEYCVHKPELTLSTGK